MYIVFSLLMVKRFFRRSLFLRSKPAKNAITIKSLTKALNNRNKIGSN